MGWQIAPSNTFKRAIRFVFLWDGLPAHRSRVVREYVRAQRGRITLGFVPGYAPELNPVEYVWGYWDARGRSRKLAERRDRGGLICAP